MKTTVQQILVVMQINAGQVEEELFILIRVRDVLMEVVASA